MITINGLTNQASTSRPTIGEIKMFAGDLDLKYWAKCDGQTLSILGNEELFSIIGITYGGDGVTDFKLPDLRGRLPMHSGQGAGLTDRDIGDSGGSETDSVTLNTAQLPSHTHSARVPCNTGTGDTQNPLFANPAKTANQNYKLASNQGMAPFNTDATGSGSAISIDTVPPFVALNFYIAIAGLLPELN